MQEEEKNAVTPTEAAETPEQPERSIAEEPAEGSETADAAETAAEVLNGGKTRVKSRLFHA